MKQTALLFWMFLCGVQSFVFAQQDSIQTPVVDSLQIFSSSLSDSVRLPMQATFTDSSLEVVQQDAVHQEEYPIATAGFVVPAALMVHGLWIRGNNGLYSSEKIREDVQHAFPGFYTPLDNYLQYVPSVAAYATGFIPGTRPRHTNGRRLWMFVQAQVFTSLTVLALKNYTSVMRPNGEDDHSFPSGHTAQAFMGAAFFDMEYPRQMRGVKIGLYSIAGLTGALAVMNDRHWGSDVLFAAGLGMLSVRMLFWSEQHWKQKKMPRSY